MRRWPKHGPGKIPFTTGESADPLRVGETEPQDSAESELRGSGGMSPLPRHAGVGGPPPRKRSPPTRNPRCNLHHLGSCLGFQKRRYPRFCSFFPSSVPQPRAGKHPITEQATHQAQYKSTNLSKHYTSTSQTRQPKPLTKRSQIHETGPHKICTCTSNHRPHSSPSTDATLLHKRT